MNPCIPTKCMIKYHKKSKNMIFSKISGHFQSFKAALTWQNHKSFRHFSHWNFITKRSFWVKIFTHWGFFFEEKNYFGQQAWIFGHFWGIFLNSTRYLAGCQEVQDIFTMFSARHDIESPNLIMFDICHVFHACCDWTLHTVEHMRGPCTLHYCTAAEWILATVQRI